MRPEGAGPELHIVEERGDPGWEALYREHVVSVYRYVFARVGNRPDAEDITSAVFTRSLPLLHRSASASEIRAYLLAASRTVLADHWRRHYGTRTAVLDDDLPAPSRSDERGDDDDVRRATEVLDRLPQHYRRILELRFLRGASVREAAATLGVTVSNAKVMQLRALRMAAVVGREVVP